MLRGRLPNRRLDVRQPHSCLNLRSRLIKISFVTDSAAPAKAGKQCGRSLTPAMRTRPIHARVMSNPKYLGARSEEHTSELQSRGHLVCRLLLEKKT